MTDSRLRVEVEGETIIVTMPGYGYRATYCKAADELRLVGKRCRARTENGAPMTQAEFHARAWKAATDKARELGWII